MHRTERSAMLRPTAAMVAGRARRSDPEQMLRSRHPLIRGVSPTWPSEALRSSWPDPRRPIGKCCAPSHRPSPNEGQSSDSSRSSSRKMRSACADQSIAATSCTIITCTHQAGLRSRSIPAHLPQSECAISRAGIVQLGAFECCAASRTGCLRGVCATVRRADVALPIRRKKCRTGGVLLLLGMILRPLLRRLGGRLGKTKVGFVAREPSKSSRRPGRMGQVQGTNANRHKSLRSPEWLASTAPEPKCFLALRVPGCCGRLRARGKLCSSGTCGSDSGLVRPGPG